MNPVEKEGLNNMNIQILDQAADDVLEVTRLLRDTWLETYPNEEFGITREEILDRYDETKPEFQKNMDERRTKLSKGQTDPDIHAWVAKEGNKIVGFCGVNKREKNQIQAIYVLPGFQGKGVGKKLMATTLDWMDPGKDVYVNVASYNSKAISFYESFGFRKTGKEFTEERLRFPSGAVIPEIEMVKKL